MRKLLQNKAVVAGLAVVAAGAVSANFISFPKLLGMSAAARPLAVVTEAAPELPLTVPSRSRLSTEQREWRELFPLNPNVRDPFAPPAEPPPTVVPELVATNSPVAPGFVLQAISYEAGRAYAVINQQVLAEGEKLSGYVVEKILPATVHLQGALGRISLTVLRNAVRPKTSPPANPAAADLPAATPVPALVPAGTNQLTRMKP